MNLNLNLKLAALIDHDRHAHASRYKRPPLPGPSEAKTRGKVETRTSIYPRPIRSSECQFRSEHKPRQKGFGWRSETPRSTSR